MNNTENTISKSKNILLVLTSKGQENAALQDLIQNFCGRVVWHLSEIVQNDNSSKIYVCGDLSLLQDANRPMFVIRELSTPLEPQSQENLSLIGLGAVPIVVHNVGVFLRKLFDDEEDYFLKVSTEHAFQDLTESNKPGKSLRRGIYLTEVSKELGSANEEVLHFRLLRCSSNFSGPTDNFRGIDHKIMNAMNDVVKYAFDQETKLNHVLAQIYENKKNEDAKESKAKIPAHSDKTKDMPKDALIAFCTFYDRATFALKPSKTDRFDWCYGDISGLARLYFKLKKSVEDENLVKEFSVTLYPNSVFLIPLSTNRLYTHEIKPSILNVDKIPTRMGYVARCSNAEAIYMNEQTFLKENGALVKLEQITPESRDQLKNLYFEENITKNRVVYDQVHFSMNDGDYLRPNY